MFLLFLVTSTVMSGAKKVIQQIQGNKTKHTIHSKVMRIRVACHCVSITRALESDFFEAASRKRTHHYNHIQKLEEIMVSTGIYFVLQGFILQMPC